MLFVSGQGALDPATGTVVQGDITVQTRQTLDNLMKTPVLPRNHIRA
jgi:2-iminobutanoate/2-iminopropanoate deaminase